jgi:hypothetical protein
MVDMDSFGDFDFDAYNQPSNPSEGATVVCGLCGMSPSQVPWGKKDAETGQALGTRCWRDKVVHRLFFGDCTWGVP